MRIQWLLAQLWEKTRVGTLMLPLDHPVRMLSICFDFIHNSIRVSMDEVVCPVINLAAGYKASDNKTFAFQIDKKLFPG